MAKELPYFRFTVSEWMNGDISMENYETQGLFAHVCAWYWFKDCSVTIAMLEKKFSNAESLQNLIDSNIIKQDGENISIEFLDEQYDMLSSKHKRRQAAGSKGGKQKSSNAKAMLKQSSSYKDKDKDKDKEKDKENIVKESSQCLMKNSGVTIDDISKAFLNTKDLKQADPEYYFQQVTDWSSNKGRMGKDWVAAIRSWARKDLADGKLKLLPAKRKLLLNANQDLRK